MESLISIFVVLLIVIDPFGIAPLFVALTRDSSPEMQKRTAVRSTALATTILLVFFLVGDELLRLLGIGLDAFRIAGGVLLFLLAIDMVFARQSGLRSTTTRERHEAEHKDDVSVFPLAFPLIAGPGALTTVLLMASSWQTGWMFVGMLAVLLGVLLVTLATLLHAPGLIRMLGETGANVITRLFGLILAALAVQYVIDGVRASF